MSERKNEIDTVMIQRMKSIIEYLFAANAVCILCGNEAQTDEIGICATCSKHLMLPDDTDKMIALNSYIDDIHVSYAYVKEVSYGVVRLKYRGEKHLARKFAALMDIKPEWDIDVATSVPMNREKQRRRGYNQAELIAKEMCLRLQIELNTDILKRIKTTKSQVGSTRTERIVSQKDSFHADGILCCGKSILLIDDVCTTGSTLNECARVLKENGAKTVYASVFAHGKS